MGYNEINAFENEIFDHGRKLMKEIESAVVLLKKNGFVVYENNKRRVK
jgi:hypothetical protein